jgi:hypothetical protein
MHNSSTKKAQSCKPYEALCVTVLEERELDLRTSGGTEGKTAEENKLTYLLTYLPYSMVQDIISKADCHSACQKVSCFLTEPEG